MQLGLRYGRVGKRGGAAGACSAFVQYFTDHQDQYNAPEDQFRQLAYNAPAPSGACCAAANQFVGQKCSCDSTLLGNAGQACRPAYVELFLVQWWRLLLRPPMFLPRAHNKFTMSCM